MPRDPGSIFGGLFAGCIRDEYLKEDNKIVVEGALFFFLGAVSSVVTAYLLSMTGLLL